MSAKKPPGMIRTEAEHEHYNLAVEHFKQIPWGYHKPTGDLVEMIGPSNIPPGYWCRIDRTGRRILLSVTLIQPLSEMEVAALAASGA